MFVDIFKNYFVPSFLYYRALSSPPQTPAAVALYDIENITVWFEYKDDIRIDIFA